MRKHGLRTLGLCLMAALGLMAFSSVAQAAEWYINGVTLKKTETISGKNTTEQLFEMQLGKSKNVIIFHCQKLTIDEGRIFGNEEEHPGTGLVTFLYTSCPTLLNGIAWSCKPVEPIQLKARILLILHEGKTYLLVEPDTGTSFGELGFRFGEESCLATGPITGEMVYQCLEPAGTPVDCATSRVTQLLSPASSAIFNGATLPLAQGLKWGSNLMTLNGSMALELSGVNIGKPWGGTV